MSDPLAEFRKLKREVKAAGKWDEAVERAREERDDGKGSPTKEILEDVLPDGVSRSSTPSRSSSSNGRIFGNHWSHSLT